MKRDERFVTSGTELRAGNSQGDELCVFGRAIAYGKLSVWHVPCQGAREQIAPFAFRDSLKGREPILCNFNHSINFLPLGSTRNGTLRLDDRPDGLHFELRLNPSIQVHRDIHQLVKDQTINSLSFEFGNAEDSWDTATEDKDRSRFFQRRTVQKADLYAISLLGSHPAYAGDATSVSARSLAYSFGPAGRPSMSDAELLRRFAAVTLEILREQRS